MTISSDRPLGNAESASVDEMLPEWTIRPEDFRADRSIGALRLEVALPPGASSELVPALVELLHSLNDRDIELGGQGLVLDQPESRATDGQLTLLLRPLDVLGSLDRCERLATMIAEQAETAADFPSAKQVPNESSQRIIETIATECSKSRDSRSRGIRSSEGISVRAVAIAP